MDLYGPSQPELFRVDDLFNFPNDELFPNNSTTTSTTNSATDSDLHHHHNPYSYDYNTACDYFTDFTNNHFSSTDFTDKFGLPSEDIAELEWLSNFVDDSSSDFPPTTFAGAVTPSSLQSRARTKRSRSTMNATWTNGRRRENVGEGLSADVERRCTHCSSEKTPQWRSGPLGPKTLCNACGVRYKSGRLVPEYRPAASPTFVLTQHSNSHRKVMELRRQKEMQAAPPSPPPQMFGVHHSRVC